jgi:hypothetical protein
MTFLIKKPIAQGDIITIKLQTAEELICRVEKDEDNTLTVSRPLTLTYGAQGVGMTPWIMTGDQDNHIAINKAMIMATTPTMKQAADQYIQGTTGIKPVGRI